MFETIDTDWIAIAAPIVAAAGLVLWYGYAPDWLKGPRATWWNTLRRLLLPLLDSAARRRGLGYASYEISDREFGGTVDASIGEVEATLWELGFERMPLAALKTTPDGRVEQGSWAYRQGPLADRQLHVMLFEADSGVDLYVHNEYNAFHPRFALKHYRGVDLKPGVGEERVQKMLEDSGLRLNTSTPITGTSQQKRYQE
jgi:hypothetical protein